MRTITQSMLPSGYSKGINKKTIIEQCNFSSSETAFYCFADPETVGDHVGSDYTVAVFTVKPKKEQTV